MVQGATARLIHWIPLIFVLLWSTGFIGAKYALPFIEPFNLLFIRMLITLGVFAALILIFSSRWPSPRQAVHQMIVGSLVHAAYLGGVFAAIKWQMPAGVASLLVGLQPLLTAVLAWAMFSNRLRPSQWFGLILGLAGVALVLLGGKGFDRFEITVGALVAAMIALIGISVGTLYQKRFGVGVNLLTGSFFQYLATAIWMALLTFLFEEHAVVWDAQLIGALLWLVFGLSVSAILLLMYMIREGEAAKVASYFYLVPPVTALEAWLLFDETLSGLAVAGMLLVVWGVYLVLKPGHQSVIRAG
ncbi:MAG: EamA family transporter [Sedimenticola sp.]|nr:MAG: EamA family transporter [Sedimenticola sp.]